MTKTTAICTLHELLHQMTARSKADGNTRQQKGFLKETVLEIAKAHEPKRAFKIVGWINAWNAEYRTDIRLSILPPR